MTTEKQAKANKANSAKSTGAKTEQGKQAVALNAAKHGIFSKRLIMPNESLDEYNELLDGLVESVCPNGMIEQLLVEKVAVAMWRQLRLTRAESASIQMRRNINQNSIRRQVANLTYDTYTSLSADDLKPATEDRRAHLESCKKVIAEVEAIGEDADLNDLATLEQSPELMAQLEAEAAGDQCETVEEYIDSLSGDLACWIEDTVEWCEKELRKNAKKAEIIEALKVVQAYESAPINNHLLTRYQVALDNELYKAITTLRKQQEWRLKANDTKAVIEVGAA